MLPEEVGRVAVEALGHECGFLEGVRGQEPKDQLEQFIRKTLDLARPSVTKQTRAMCCGRRTAEAGSSPRAHVVATAQLELMLQS